MSSGRLSPILPRRPALQDRRTDAARPHRGAHQEEPARAGAVRNWERMLNEPFRGITTDGNVIPDLFAPRPEGAPTLAMIEAVNALLAAHVARSRRSVELSGRLQPVAALAEHRALCRGLRAAPRRGRRAAARRGDGGAARQHERARLRAVARRDAAQPLPRRPGRRPGGAGRMELHLLPVRQAVGERALGLAVLRPSPRAQLLRARPADGAHPGVLGRRAELRRSRPVQGHPHVPGRGARRPHADALVLGRAADSAPSSPIR